MDKGVKQHNAGTDLTGRRVLFGVSGGIAAFKAAAAVSRLRQMGADVDVVMTAAAAAFVTPLTFEALAGRPVLTNIFSPRQPGAIDHLELAYGADIALVAPATANIIGKLALGIADDPLTTVFLSVRAPVLIAPAMESRMYDYPAVQDNLERLRAQGWRILEPGAGHLASGRRGPGRMPEPDELIAAAAALLQSRDDLKGRRVLITAGPTREYLDPVRFISNPSSGRMGYALAAAARDRGADVVLISGPVSLPAPFGVELVQVESTLEMHDAVLAKAPAVDVVIKSAAVSDYRAAERQAEKTKKGAERQSLELIQNPDILAELGRRKRPGQILVGFAAESRDAVRFGWDKLRRKQVDLMVVNDITEPGAGFAHPTNHAQLLHAGGQQQDLPLMPKRGLAEHILDAVTALLAERSGEDQP